MGTGYQFLPAFILAPTPNASGNNQPNLSSTQTDTAQPNFLDLIFGNNTLGTNSNGSNPSSFWGSNTSNTGSGTQSDQAAAMGDQFKNMFAQYGFMMFMQQMQKQFQQQASTNNQNDSIPPNPAGGAVNISFNPPTSTSATTAPRPNITPRNAVQSIEQNSDLSEFKTLLDKAGLLKADSPLKTDPSLTVFAPSNKAIQSLSQSTRDKLAQNPSALLELMKNHVLSDSIDTKNINGNVTTMQGRQLKIKHRRNGSTFVRNNGQNANINYSQMTTNGSRVNVIDRLLIPDNLKTTFA